jgi:hypothetical protein
VGCFEIWGRGFGHGPDQVWAAEELVSLLEYKEVTRQITAGCEPAMEDGLTDHLWSLEESVGVLETKAVGVAA